MERRAQFFLFVLYSLGKRKKEKNDYSMLNGCSLEMLVNCVERWKFIEISYLFLWRKFLKKNILDFGIIFHSRITIVNINSPTFASSSNLMKKTHSGSMNSVEILSNNILFKFYIILNSFIFKEHLCVALARRRQRMR